MRLAAATTLALGCRCPKNSPTPSRPSRSRRPPLPSCRTSASPDKIKNSSAAASPRSTTYEPGGYQRTWTWLRIWPRVLAASASSSRAWAKAGGPAKRPARLAPGRRYHHDLGTLPGVVGERAPGAERLVVGMGEDTQQPAAASRWHAVIEQARPGGARLARARPSSVTMLCLRGHGLLLLWRVDIRAFGGQLPVTGHQHISVVGPRHVTTRVHSGSMNRTGSCTHRFTSAGGRCGCRA